MANEIFLIARRVIAALWMYGILGQWAEDFLFSTFERAESLRPRKRIIVSKVAGVTYEGRQVYLAVLRGSEPCRIVPEPDNKFDPNALAVHVAIAPGDVRHVGYVPRELAAQIAPHLEGESVMVKIAEITGGFETRWGDIAAYGLRIAIELPDSAEVN